MTLVYLQEQLFRASRLSYNALQHSILCAEANDIKLKVSEALKVLFPNDKVYALTVSFIKFEAPYGDRWDNFEAGRKTLISMIEAKIDLLVNTRNITTNKLVKKVTEDTVATIKLGSLEKRNQELSEIIDTQEKTILQLTENNTKCEQEVYRLKKFSISKLSNWVWSLIKISFWFWAVGTLAVIVPAFYFFGKDNAENRYNKEDFDTKRVNDSLSRVNTELKLNEQKLLDTIKNLNGRLQKFQQKTGK